MGTTESSDGGEAARTRRLGSVQVADHPTVAERVARGKAARNATPRSSQAEFSPGSDRPDPIALLEEQAKTRVADLVPIRYGRMLASPFAFYRGAALIMASDLATTPRSGLTAQLCGDAHMLNFGMFGSPERNLVFDVNDFDETLPGPFEWDLKRLAASVAVGGRSRNFSEKDRARAILASVDGYRTAMTQWAAAGNLEVWYAHIDLQQLMDDLGSSLNPVSRKRTESGMAKARTRDSHQALDKLTTVVDGERRIISDPPLIVPIDQMMGGELTAQTLEMLRSVLRRYRRSLQSDRRHLLEQFELIDVAHKVVGVGSVGTRAWIVLLQGRDGNDPLFLQAKEAQPSVLERFVGKSKYPNAGQRVVVGQHLMQATSDIFLGWDRVDGLDGQKRDFYFRQLRDWKGSMDADVMIPDGLVAYGRVCGLTLARAHARSGDRIAIAAYLGSGTTFDRAIVSFAEAYADQNERDYAALQAAVKSGRIVAETGV